MRDLLPLLEQLGSREMLVVADLYLDRYLFGKPSRLSREAPIMVLDEDRIEDRLGGGAAPALQLARLGYAVQVAGVVGADEDGAIVRRLLAEHGIDTSRVLTDPGRPTTTKTRVVAEGFFVYPQQMVRIDRQDRRELCRELTQELAGAIAASAAAAVLVSDYGSGVVSPQVVAAVRSAQSERSALATADSQGGVDKFNGFDLVKCNQAEVEAFVGRLGADGDARRKVLQAFRERIGVEELVVTRGGAGASIAGAEGYHEVPASNRSEIFDVTGAGDVVLAVMTAAMLAGGSVVDAARLAQAAAGVVVRKWGNQQADRDEIAAELGSD